MICAQGDEAMLNLAYVFTAEGDTLLQAFDKF
jgi:hypothetical protein